MADKKGYKEILVIEQLGLNTEIKYARLDAKKTIEGTYKKMLIDPATGNEVEKKLVVTDEAPQSAVGGVGVATEAPKREYRFFYKDGKQFTGEPEERILNKLTGKFSPVAKEKFLSFTKFVDKGIMNQFFIEEVYSIWGDNTPALLKLAEDLSNSGKVAVFQWAPNGNTVYHGFLHAQYDHKIEHFWLLMSVARLKYSTILGEGMSIDQAFNLQDTMKTADAMEEM